MGQFLIQVFLEIVGFYTAKVVLPLLSFGYLRALHSPFHAVANRKLWGEWAIRRLPQGRFGVESDLAGVFGLLFWIAVIVGAHLIFGTST